MVISVAEDVIFKFPSASKQILRGGDNMLKRGERMQLQYNYDDLCSRGCDLQVFNQLKIAIMLDELDDVWGITIDGLRSMLE